MLLNADWLLALTFQAPAIADALIFGVTALMLFASLVEQRAAIRALRTGCDDGRFA